MELYIVRHGQTVWNAMGKLQGSVDIELNEDGREVAGRLGEQLEGVRLDKIFSSPLIRAYETACLIRGHRNIKIERDNRLKEISFGKEEGIEYEKWNSPQSPYRFFFTEPGKYIPPEGGETFEAVCHRTKEFVREKIEPLYTECERIMIVAHGALNSAIMCYIEGYGTDNFWGRGLSGNCEVRVFDFDGCHWTIK